MVIGMRRVLLHTVMACLFGLANMPAKAGLQSVAGLTCSNGEFSYVEGAAFAAVCSGDLYSDPASVLRAVDSIMISAGRSMTLRGTLVAPYIELSAGGALLVEGGLFSGSPERLPEVLARSRLDSGRTMTETFRDLVSRPFVHPVYGSVTLTAIQVIPVPVSIETISAVFVPSEPAAPHAAAAVSEPPTGSLMLLAGLLVLSRQAGRRR